MTITIRPELEARLRQRAAQEGREPEDVVEELLAAALDWSDIDQAEAVEGIRRGLEASAAGKVRPLSQVIAEARQRHGFPESWPLETDAA